MQKLLFTIVIAALGSASFAQTVTVNDANAEERKVSNFHAIEIEDGIDLYLSQGSQESLAISASNEHKSKIKTVVENGVLKIYYDSNSPTGWRNRNLKAYVGFTNLDKVSAAAGADVVVRGVLTTKTLTMKLSGGSDFVGKVEVTELEFDQSGGSDVRVSGTANNLKVHASGGSDFRGYELLTNTADLHASGGSDAEIYVAKELSANASGGSDVYYKGNAVIKHSSSGGGGSISKRG